MKKKIATLDVVINSDCPVSHLMTHNPTSFTLEICPIADMKILKGKLTKEDLTAIVAHELGHFVAHILHLPKESRRNWLDDDRLPSEKEAWDVAEKIVPGVKDSAAYRESIRAYSS